MATEKIPVQLYPVGGGRRNPRRADAFITKHGVSYKVHSPALVDGLLESFMIANLAPDVAMVTLPAQIVLPGVGPVDVPPQNIAEFALQSGAGGKCFYSVVMRVDGDLVTAQGSSDPVIIIDPQCP
jgi:hypothetical protein